ncbi:hypothetical protein Fot_38138 [Forsythia ovata]|uniref:Uncharacterized protein n=1 Tax=Forsythia ovata TaxID=205694 RepID=A0ABD1S0Z1_9LAMI
MIVSSQMLLICKIFRAFSRSHTEVLSCTILVFCADRLSRMKVLPLSLQQWEGYFLSNLFFQVGCARVSLEGTLEAEIGLFYLLFPKVFGQTGLNGQRESNISLQFDVRSLCENLKYPSFPVRLLSTRRGLGHVITLFCIIIATSASSHEVLRGVYREYCP